MIQLQSSEIHVSRRRTSNEKDSYDNAQAFSRRESPVGRQKKKREVDALSHRRRQAEYSLKRVNIWLCEALDLGFALANVPKKKKTLNGKAKAMMCQMF